MAPGCARLVLAGLALALALGLAGAGAAHAAVYYVTPDGSDFNPGTSPDLPWRTMGHINQAELQPGDEVLFAAGQTWVEPLAPKAHGTRKRRITFGTFGEGRANLAGGVFLLNSRWLSFRSFSISGVSQAVLGGSGGKGSRGIVVQDFLIEDVSIAVNAANRGDRGWRIEDNIISRTGDSAIIVNGRNFVVARNQITDAGTSAEIPFAKHGVYAKGPRITIEHNTIDGASDSGVSTRFPNALIQWNRITRAALGVGYFQNADTGGVSIVRHNSIHDVENGIFLADSEVERFVVHGNAIVARANGIRAKAVVGLRAWDNAIVAESPLHLATRQVPRPALGYVDETVEALAVIEQTKLRGVNSKSGPRLTMTVSCSVQASERCDLSIVVERGKRRLGRATSTLAPGQRHAIQIPIGRVRIAGDPKARRYKALKVLVVTRDGANAVTRGYTTVRVRL